MIIALEGPSYAGKTTALRHLRTLPSMADVLIMDCYVKMIPRIEDIPRPSTESAAEQLAAFEAFMALEAQRVQAVVDHDGPVILDRSVDTLLAHAHAMDVIYGFGVHDRARALLGDLPHLAPDHTLYLDVPLETLALRRKAAGHTETEPDYFLHDPEFLTHARSYFCAGAHHPVTSETVTVPGDGCRRDTATVVQTLITHWMGR
ncbi:hypothetical protein [Streptomyces sp. NPDC058157]|uniref:hypothetical protein n=1 Tax=Streptomyces sp. NPDC058157 TaxID=3346360 RepID=UPI0036EAD0FD